MGWMLRHYESDDVHQINSEIFVIGRDKDAHLICRNILVSKYHSQISREKNGFLAVIDLSSSNGTYVNSERITPHEKRILKEGDQVSFGMTVEKLSETSSSKQPSYIYNVCRVPDIVEILTSDDEFEASPQRAQPIAVVKIEEDLYFNPVNRREDSNLLLELTSTQKQPNKPDENQPSIPDRNGNKPPLKPLPRCLNNRLSIQSTGSNSSIDTITPSSDHLPPVKITQSLKTVHCNVTEGVLNNNFNLNVSKELETAVANSKSNGEAKNLKREVFERLELEKPSCSKVEKGNGLKLLDLEDEDVNMEISRLELNEIPVEDNVPEKTAQGDEFPVGKIHIATNLFSNPEICNNPAEQQSNLPNCALKQEPHSTQDYSKGDNVIAIDDDGEEDMDFMFSQLYVKPEIKVEEIIETENPSPRNDYLIDDDVILIDDDGDDLLMSVCSQIYVKEETFCNENAENIAVTNNADAILANRHSKVNDEVFLNIKKELAALDNFDDLSKLPPIVLHDTMEFSDGEDIFNIAADKVDDVVEPSTSKRSVDVSKPYTKPPIIEPHEILPKTKNKRQAHTKLKDLVPAKKIKIPKKQATGKRKRSPAKKSPVSAKSKDKDLQDARRRKLKEIAERAAPQTRSKTDENKKITTAKHTKTSTGRGNFLLPTGSAPVASPRVTVASRYQKIQNSSHIIPNKRFLEEYRDVVKSIVTWNQKWIQEQRNKDTLPPVAGREVIKMCDSFSSHHDYHTVLQPLIITELWFNFCKEFECSSFSKQINSSENLIAKITDVRTTNSFTEITCTSYLDKKSADSGNHIQVKNIVLLNAYFGTEKNSCKTFFGVVVWFQKEQLKMNSNTDQKMVQACGSMPTKKLSFMLVVKKFSEQINQNYHINMRYFTFLPQYLRLISSVKSLGASPLLNHIIEPKYTDYIINHRKRRDLLGSENLNLSQQEVLSDVLSLYESNKPGMYLIEGPPGTGKSTVIINILLEVLRNPQGRNSCLLLLAPSNGAIDSIIHKIMFCVKPNLKEEDRQKIKLVRVGNINAISQNVFKYSLDELAKAAVHSNFMREHPQTQRDYEILGQQIQELREKLRYAPNDKQLGWELERKMSDRKNFAQNYLKSKYRSKLDEQRVIVLNHANIICSTIMSSPKILIKGFNMSCIRMCIIDEASQCSEPETLVPIGLGIDKIVLVGDPQQLPAISSSILVKNYGYCRSLFSRIKVNLNRQKVNPIKMLNVQYRMHPEISSFPNHTYYHGKLQTKFTYRKKPLERLQPYLVFSQTFMNTKEYENEREVELLMILIKAISYVVTKECNFSIGIITPYTVQRRSINAELGKINLRRNVTVTCNTVDSFQGQEKDIILLSCVRNTPNSFLSDEQRLNVSITRAKYALYIIGTESLLKSCSVLKKISGDAQKRNLYCKLSCNMSETIFADLITKKK